MQNQDLEAGLAGLSRDEIAKILRDLAAADPAIEKRIMTALESSQPSASDKNPATGLSFLDRVSRILRWTTRTEATPAATTPTPAITPTQAITSTPENTANDVQECENCHELFRISEAKYFFSGCFSHTGWLETVRTPVRDGDIFEQMKPEYHLHNRLVPIGDERWTCCFGQEFARGCTFSPRHVCTNPVSKAEAAAAEAALA